MAEDQLQVILKEQNVAKENAENLLKAFGAPFQEAGLILSNYKDIVVTEEDEFDLMAQAREKRLALKNVRVEVEKKRKELKEDSLKTGRAIDSVAKYVKDTIQPAEEYLEQQEKFGEIKAAERKAQLKSERIEKLSQYSDDLSLYNLDGMSEDQYDILLARLKFQHETELAQAKKLEDERIAKEKADHEERERIRSENAWLKKEAEEREVALAEERRKTLAEAEKLRKEQEAERKIAQDKLDQEKAKRELIEKEQRESLEKAEEEKRQSLLAPDKEKLLKLASDLEELRLPALASKDAQAVLDNAEQLLVKVSTYIRGNVKGL